MTVLSDFLHLSFLSEHFCTSDDIFQPFWQSQGSKATGAFILTASHNPGGPSEVYFFNAVSICYHDLAFTSCCDLVHILGKKQTTRETMTRKTSMSSKKPFLKCIKS